MESGKPYLKRPDYSWLTPSVRLLLIAHCLVAFMSQTTFAFVDLRYYALAIPGALSVIFWLLSAGLSIVASIALLKHRQWFAAPLLITETLIALSALYILWADFTSPELDLVLDAAAVLMLVPALFVIPPLTVKLTLLPGKAWAGGVALLSAFGLTQFTVENFIVPNRSLPVLEISATLQDAGTSTGTTHVRGVITFKNAGKATIWLPQAIASIVAATGHPGATVPLDAQSVLDTFDPVQGDDVVFSRPLPAGASTGTIWMDDLEPASSILPPGMSDRREFIIDVERAKVRHLELRVNVTALTNARWENARTCTHKTNALASGFLDDFHKLVKSGKWSYSCFEVPFRSANAVHYLADDSPKAEMDYVFAAPEPRWIGAQFSYQSQEREFPDPLRAQRTSESIDRHNPGVIMTTTADLALPLDGPPDAGAGGKSGG